MGNLLTRACRNIRSFSTMVFSLPSRPTDWFGRKGKSPEGRESGGPSTRRLLANQEFLSKLVGSARLNLWNGSRLPLNHIALRAAVFGVFLCITFVMPRWSQAQTCISALLLGKCRLGWAHQCGGSLRFDIFSDNLDASSTNSPPPKRKTFFGCIFPGKSADICSMIYVSSHIADLGQAAGILISMIPAMRVMERPT